MTDNRTPGTAPVQEAGLADELECTKRAFMAGWSAKEVAGDQEAFALYPPTKCADALELYLCSLSDRNLTALRASNVQPEATSLDPSLEGVANLERLQAAWDASDGLPLIEFTQEEADTLLAALSAADLPDKRGEGK